MGNAHRRAATQAASSARHASLSAELYRKEAWAAVLQRMEEDQRDRSAALRVRLFGSDDGDSADRHAELLALAAAVLLHESGKAVDVRSLCSVIEASVGVCRVPEWAAVRRLHGEVALAVVRDHHGHEQGAPFRVPLAAGLAVRGEWKGRYFAATVRRVNTDGTVKVRWEKDGTFTKRLAASRLLVPCRVSHAITSTHWDSDGRFAAHANIVANVLWHLPGSVSAPALPSPRPEVPRCATPGLIPTGPESHTNGGVRGPSYVAAPGAVWQVSRSGSPRTSTPCSAPPCRGFQILPTRRSEATPRSMPPRARRLSRCLAGSRWSACGEHESATRRPIRSGTVRSSSTTSATAPAG